MSQTVLALASEHEQMWWITLGAGLVVLVVVSLLLGALLRRVREIDEAVQAAWEAGTRVAANTATTWMLERTGTHVRELREELDAHVDLLGGSEG